MGTKLCVIQILSEFGRLPENPGDLETLLYIEILNELIIHNSSI